MSAASVPMPPFTHLILEGRYTGFQCTLLRADRDGILVDVHGMLVTFHPSALFPLPSSS